MKGIRPMTLYKRMAYAASVNTVRNVRLAHKNGNYTYIIAGGAGNYLTGLALLGLYDSLLGTTPPEETSETWKRVIVPFWRGETMGIMAEFGTLIFGKMEVGLFSQVAIAGNMESFYNNLMSIIGRTKSPKQGINDYLEDTWGQWSAVKKIKERAGEGGRFNRTAIRVRRAYNSYKEEFGVPGENEAEYKRTIASPYYEDLRDSFYMNSPEDFMRQYLITYLATATRLYNDSTKTYTLKGAYRRAGTIMKQKLSAFNPLVESANVSNQQFHSTAKQFVGYLKSRNIEVHNEAGWAYREYLKRVAYVKRNIKGYMASQNLKEYSQYMQLKAKEFPK